MQVCDTDQMGLPANEDFTTLVHALLCSHLLASSSLSLIPRSMMYSMRTAGLESLLRGNSSARHASSTARLYRLLTGTSQSRT